MSRPIDLYEPKGYAPGSAAVDAAVAFTASALGPPFSTEHTDGGDWWTPAYDCACAALERSIISALEEADSK